MGMKCFESDLGGEQVFDDSLPHPPPSLGNRV